MRSRIPTPVYHQDLKAHKSSHSPGPRGFEEFADCLLSFPQFHTVPKIENVRPKMFEEQRRILLEQRLSASEEGRENNKDSENVCDLTKC